MHTLTRRAGAGGRPSCRIYKRAGRLQPHNTTTCEPANRFNTNHQNRYKMRGIGGALIVAGAALLVCCSADPHRENELSGEGSGKRYDVNGHKNRIMHPMFEAGIPDNARSSYGSNLQKMLDYISRTKDYGKYPMSQYETNLYGNMNDDYTKRNFDEIDRSNLDTFVAKRNMDEIDRSNMPFPYAIKRFYHLYGSNYLDLDTPVSSFDKKRYRPDYPMDEIDLSHFPIGSKRSLTNFPLTHNLQ